MEAVGASSSRPLSYSLAFPFTVEGRAASSSDVPQATYSAVSPNYFRTIGTPLKQGREFTERDRTGATEVAIINETMQRRFFPEGDPIGRRLTVDYLGAPLKLEIIGVVRDSKVKSVTEEPSTEIYVSYLQRPWFSMDLLVRTSGDPEASVASVKSAIRAVDKSQTVSYLKTIDQLFSDSIARPRFYTLLLGAFAALALALAAVGIYGVISYSVTQRTHEIGVRMALGAKTGDVLRLVVGQGMLLAGIGIAVGLAGSLAATRVMVSLLYGVGAIDPLTMIAVATLRPRRPYGVPHPGPASNARRSLVALRYE
ncbi:MAG: ABC transporter permease [Pyrinomonadaceae bacterium]